MRLDVCLYVEQNGEKILKIGELKFKQPAALVNYAYDDLWQSKTILSFGSLDLKYIYKTEV